MLQRLLFFFAFLPILPSTAQKGVYDDLLVLYVDEEYEKCIFKADRYTQKDDTRRDALPFLYLSMCYHEMSKLEKFTSMDEYKYASRDALKYAVKYRKKDKNLEFFRNYEDYWAELNTVAMDGGFYYMDTKSFSKAKRQFQRMVGYDPANAGAWQMLALAQAKMNLQRDFAESLKKYEEALAAIPDMDRLPEDQKRLLRTSMIRTAEHYLEKGMRDKASATLEPGKDQFMENPEFKSLYDTL